MSHLPRVACINDMSGFGRCSLTTAIPVLSSLRCQACPAPTAILSKQTGFDSYYFFDMDNRLKTYLENWDSIAFDAVYTGFFGSSEQIKISIDFIEIQNSLVVIDPVMGDHGTLYPVFDEKYCAEMKKLITHADIITPNVTEACFLSEINYTGDDISDEKAVAIAETLLAKGCKSVIITGISHKENIKSLVLHDNKSVFINGKRCKGRFSGMGDLFSSIITGSILNKKNLIESVEFATKFLYKTINFTEEIKQDPMDGIAFEPFLCELAHFLEEKR